MEDLHTKLDLALLKLAMVKAEAAAQQAQYAFLVAENKYLTAAVAVAKAEAEALDEELIELTEIIG